MPGLRVRKSIRVLQDEYDQGNTEPLSKLVRAWDGIQKLLPSDDNSFFKIGGLHGEPFRGAGWGNAAWWGGFCNHGNVLFPTWHRAYVNRLEQALGSIEGCEDVAMAYWDETEEYTKEHGLPTILTAETFNLDGVEIKNPLRSYKFQQYVGDNVPANPGADLANYSKPVNYETVRFPYSGLVGTPEDQIKTEKYNAGFTTDEATNMLNENIKTWLGDGPLINSHGDKIQTRVGYKFAQCLLAPNYTVFSNATSATQWNDDNFQGQQGVGPSRHSPPPSTSLPVVPLESPHNDIHLACGGFDLGEGGVDIKAADDANGDMGENDTAGFDPLFFFHHCFIDKVFHDWQVATNHTESFDIIPKYPGTNSVDGQGPTPGVPGNAWLTLDSPLDPFERLDGTGVMTSRDVINIESQLGYTYSSATVSPSPAKPAPVRGTVPHPAVLRVTNINRGTQPGSFLIKVWRRVNGVERVVATESVLSRWHVSGCANCQTHLNVKAHLPILDLPYDQAGEDDYRVEVKYRPRATQGDRPPLRQPKMHLGFMNKAPA